MRRQEKITLVSLSTTSMPQVMAAVMPYLEGMASEVKAMSLGLRGIIGLVRGSPPNPVREAVSDPKSPVRPRKTPREPPSFHGI